MGEFARRGWKRAGELTGKSVGRAVGVDHGLLAFGPRLGVAVLHADDALKALLVDVLEDVAVIDFAGARLFAARIVARLQVGDLVPAGIKVGDEVTLGDLLVVEVEQDAS